MNTTPGKTVKTPAGAVVTAARYLALIEAQRAIHGDASACTYGHFGCAAWTGGPCGAEVAAAQESPTQPTPCQQQQARAAHASSDSLSIEIAVRRVPLTDGSLS